MKTKCIGCLKVVSVASRFRMFEYLKASHEPVTVTSLARLVHLRQPTATFHINKLADVGLVKKQKIGKEVFVRAYQRCEDCPLFI